MILAIPDILTPAQLAEGRKILEAAEWTDGKATAGHIANKVKDNMQIPFNHPAAKQVGDMILKGLVANPLFMTAALPLHILPPRFNRYSGGQTYGNHVDAAIQTAPATGHRIRSDLSCTFFFAEPSEYDGGELIIEDTYGTKGVKLPAGQMILYPGTTLHRVTPVTRGTRLCSFFWIQSMIRDDARRGILFEQDIAIQRLGIDHPGHPSISQLTGVYHNLLRQWSEL